MINGATNDFDVEREAIVSEARPQRAKTTQRKGPDPIPLLDGPSLAAPLPDLEYLVRDLGMVAGAGAPHIVAGYGFAGKTLSMQSLALSLVTGRAVWGGYPCTQRRVVHIDFEQGERLTRRRYQRLALAMAVDLSTLGDALVVAVMPSLTLAPSDEWRRLMTGRDLIVIDSLRAASGGADENESTIRGGLDYLTRVSEETRCRALVIHHARKPSDANEGDARYAIRGSSAIYDAGDSVYILAAAKGEPVALTHSKARSHGEPVPDSALIISDVDIGGDPRAGLQVQAHGHEIVTRMREERDRDARAGKARRDAATVRAAIAHEPGIHTRALREATALSGDRLAAALVVIAAEIERREVSEGRIRLVRHYLRGAP